MEQENTRQLVKIEKSNKGAVFIVSLNSVNFTALAGLEKIFLETNFWGLLVICGVDYDYDLSANINPRSCRANLMYPSKNLPTQNVGNPTFSIPTSYM